MKIYKSTLFTGVMSECIEYRNIDDFKLLPTISSIDLIDLYLKCIGSAFSKRKPTDIVNTLINDLHKYCNNANLTFCVDELENGELFIKIDDINYIFDNWYLRIIIPVEYVTDFEIKEN